MRNKWLLYPMLGLIVIVLAVIMVISISNSTPTLPEGKYHTQCFQNGQVVLDIVSYGPAPEKDAVRMGTTMWGIVWFDENGDYQTFPYTGQLACRPEYLGPIE